jgi:hypothetical protein
MGIQVPWTSDRHTTDIKITITKPEEMSVLNISNTFDPVQQLFWAMNNKIST